MRPGRQISVRSTLAIVRHFPIPLLYGSPRNRSFRANHDRHSRSCTGRRWDRCSSEPILRRSGHSFIWDWLVSSLTTATTIPSSSLQTSKRDDTKLEGEKEKEEERTLYRYSMVHAHPLGPWEAILSAVKRHYYNDMNQTAYHILDVGCGPRGQPGTTIANALPLVSVHCIDSCHGAIRAVPIRSIHPIMISPFVKIDTTTRFIMSCVSAPPMSFVQIPLTPLPLLSSISPMLPPPSNLIKSICNMDNLSQRFLPNSVHVIVSCFGYGSSSNNNSNDSANATTVSETDQILSSLRQAYDTLLPGGILILCTWQYSSLLALSHDMNITLQHGCGDSAAMIRVQHQNHIDEGAVRNDISSSSSSSSSSGSRRYPKIQYSDTDEWEDLLYQAGFQKPDQIQSSIHTYPICLGKTPRQQFNFSTLLIPLDVQEYYNNNNNSYQTWSDCLNTATQKSSATSSGYRNNTEEAFWMNVMEHTDPSNTGCTSQTNDNDPHCHDPNVDTSMWMPKNIFKLTIATK